jgi:hypothetical protein
MTADILQVLRDPGITAAELMERWEEAQLALEDAERSVEVP